MNATDNHFNSYQHVDTDGGIYASGDIHIGEGDFVGRDKLVEGDEVAGHKVIVGTVNLISKNVKLPLQRPPRVPYFIGRQLELFTILTNLQPGKVITLCGPGGMGKSAIAIEALWSLAPADSMPSEFPDGIIFYNFYDRPSMLLAFEHIVRSYDEDPYPDPMTAAQRILAGRKALIVLDGTEHVNDLDKVLSICGSCGVLITSRHRKDASVSRIDLIPLSDSEAALLLTAWAGNRVSNSEIALRICNLLGGVPLAIRLAGRYMAEREENASDYLTWLNTSLLLALDFGNRQTESIPILLENSLKCVDQVAVEIMSIVGTLAIAPLSREEILAALAHLSSVKLINALGQLVAYGLLKRQELHYEVTHVLIYTYAKSRLNPSIQSLKNLINYYNFALTQSKASEEAHFRSLDSSKSHILALLEKLNKLDIEERRDLGPVVISITLILDEYFDYQGYFASRKSAIEVGLAFAELLGNQFWIGIFLGLLGIVITDIGDTQHALRCFEHGLLIAQRLGNKHCESMHLGGLGNIYIELGEYEQALAHYQLALNLSRVIGDRRGEGRRLLNCGYAYYKLNALDLAMQCYRQSLDISRDIIDQRTECMALNNLGVVLRVLEEIEESVVYFNKALQIAQKIADRRSIGNCLTNLGITYQSIGEGKQALKYLEQSIATFEAIETTHVEQARTSLIEAYIQDFKGEIESTSLIKSKDKLSRILLLSDNDSPTEFLHDLLYSKLENKRSVILHHALVSETSLSFNALALKSLAIMDLPGINGGILKENRSTKLSETTVDYNTTEAAQSNHTTSSQFRNKQSKFSKVKKKKKRKTVASSRRQNRKNRKNH